MQSILPCSYNDNFIEKTFEQNNNNNYKKTLNSKEVKNVSKQFLDALTNTQLKNITMEIIVEGIESTIRTKYGYIMDLSKSDRNMIKSIWKNKLKQKQ